MLTKKKGYGQDGVWEGLLDDVEKLVNADTSSNEDPLVTPPREQAEIATAASVSNGSNTTPTYNQVKLFIDRKRKVLGGGGCSTIIRVKDF